MNKMNKSRKLEKCPRCGRKDMLVEIEDYVIAEIRIKRFTCYCGYTNGDAENNINEANK